jgi:tripartite-type tricarboxylate transporter receptor subunit TctC
MHQCRAVRALAMTSRERSLAALDIPTVAEAGLRGVELFPELEAR